MVGLLILFATALAILIALLTAVLAWEMVHPPRHTVAWALARKLPADPGELNLPFEEWWLDRPDGARLAVWEISRQRSAISDQPSKSSSQNPKSPVEGLTAVFIHGWGHSRIDSLQRIGPFVPLVDRIVLYDLRGHGESTGGLSRLGDGEDDDLLGLLERLGDGRFLLVGHSMGAVIALNAAAKANANTARIAGVIAYAPYCEFHRSLQGRLRVNGLPSRPISDLALLAQRLRGVRPASLDLDRLRDLHTPVLLIHGGSDQVVPMEHAERIVSAVRDATLVEIDHAAHADAHSLHAAGHDAEVQRFVVRLRLPE